LFLKDKLLDLLSSVFELGLTNLNKFFRTPEAASSARIEQISIRALRSLLKSLSRRRFRIKMAANGQGLPKYGN
jgi:hypothetical protein